MISGVSGAGKVIEKQLSMSSARSFPYAESTEESYHITAVAQIYANIRASVDFHLVESAWKMRDQTFARHTYATYQYAIWVSISLLQVVAFCTKMQQTCRRRAVYTTHAQCTEQRTAFRMEKFVHRVAGRSDFERLLPFSFRILKKKNLFLLCMYTIDNNMKPWISKWMYCNSRETTSTRWVSELCYVCTDFGHLRVRPVRKINIIADKRWLCNRSHPVPLMLKKGSCPE